MLFGPSVEAPQGVLQTLRLSPDIVDLACLTGFRRADLCDVTFDKVIPQAIIRIARKKSRGQRSRAVVPLLAETVALIERLPSRYRKPGVDAGTLHGIGSDDYRKWTGCGLRRHRQRARVQGYGFEDVDGTEHSGNLADDAAGTSGARTPCLDCHREARSLGDSEVERTAACCSQ